MAERNVASLATSARVANIIPFPNPVKLRTRKRTPSVLPVTAEWHEGFLAGLKVAQRIQREGGAR